MFMITGPNSPFCNLAPAIETHVDIISDLIAIAETKPSLLAKKTIVNGIRGRSTINGHNINNDHNSTDGENTTNSHSATTGLNQVSATVSNSTSASKVKPAIIEASPAAENSWTDLCDSLTSKNLFRTIKSSWIFGANVPGQEACHAVLIWWARTVQEESARAPRR